MNCFVIFDFLNHFICIISHRSFFFSLWSLNHRWFWRAVKQVICIDKDCVCSFIISIQENITICKIQIGAFGLYIWNILDWHVFWICFGNFLDVVWNLNFNNYIKKNVCINFFDNYKNDHCVCQKSWNQSLLKFFWMNMVHVIFKIAWMTLFCRHESFTGEQTQTNKPRNRLKPMKSKPKQNQQLGFDFFKNQKVGFGLNPRNRKTRNWKSKSMDLIQNPWVYGLNPRNWKADQTDLRT